jgi:phage baseplate assembly protein gpV
MAAVSATTEAKGSSSHRATTSFYVEEEDHMLGGMADANGVPMDAFATTQSKTVVHDAPRGGVWGWIHSEVRPIAKPGCKSHLH